MTRMEARDLVKRIQILPDAEQSKILSRVMRAEGKKVKGTIVPVSSQTLRRVTDTPFFGMHKRDRRPVNEIVAALRGGRTRAL